MNKLPTIWLDMDGTIADLYAVDNWLALLQEENTRPYAIAKPLLSADQIKWLQEYIKRGGTVGIISWTSKAGTAEYNKAVRATKVKWLKEYLPLPYAEIHIVKYGTNKGAFGKTGDILIDDEEQNLQNFVKRQNKLAFHPKEWNRMVENIKVRYGIGE